MANLSSFYDKMIHLVEKGKAVVVYLDFSKTFDTVSHGILWKDKLLMVWTDTGSKINEYSIKMNTAAK